MNEPIQPQAAQVTEPAAPATPAPEAPAPAQQTPPADVLTKEPEADAESQEWDSAQKKLFPGLKSVKKEGGAKDEPTEPTKVVEEKTTPEGKAEEENPEDGQGGEEPTATDTSARDARIAARQSAQQLESVRSDVREQMFTEVPRELRDASGDPIRTIEDVMQLENPRTGQAFTEEEAGMWLLSAQQQFNQNLANIDRQIDDIAETNMDLKDQADAVNTQYGELLKAMPDLKTKIWQEYEKTLVRDEKSGIIIKAPVSLENFYDTALSGYAKLAEQLENNAEATVADQAQAQEQAKVEAESQRQNARADRADIYGGSQTDADDPEDKEWAAAATKVFGPRK